MIRVINGLDVVPCVEDAGYSLLTGGTPDDGWYGGSVSLVVEIVGGAAVVVVVVVLGAVTVVDGRALTEMHQIGRKEIMSIMSTRDC